MQRSNRFAGWTLALTLAFSSAALTGCEDEKDPKTWIGKLGDDAKRAGAMKKLKDLYDETMSAAGNDPQNPKMKEFTDKIVGDLVKFMGDHPDDLSSRAIAVEMLAGTRDPRAVPGLISALTYTGANRDAQSTAGNAVEALKKMAPSMGAAEKQQTATALLALLRNRVSGPGSVGQIRYNSIQTLGELKAVAAVQPLSEMMTVQLNEMLTLGIGTAQAIADALGKIGEAGAADALVYGLFLKFGPQDINLFCQRALARLPADAVVPRLLTTFQGRNEKVQALMASYATASTPQEIPPGAVQARSAEVLGVFAAPAAADALLETVAKKDAPQIARVTASEALARIALVTPAQKARIVTALTAVFNETAPDKATPEQIQLMAAVASHLGITGDPSVSATLIRVLKAPAMAATEQFQVRLTLLSALALSARHGDLAGYEEISRSMNGKIDEIINSAPAEARTQVEGQARVMRTALSGLDAVAGVAKDCNDGDRNCYVGKLSGNTDIARKAAFMLAWTTPAAEQEQGRMALLEKLNHPDNAVRRGVMIAIDALSPGGCPACIEKLNALIEAEKGQASHAISHVDALLLIARLKARATGT